MPITNFIFHVVCKSQRTGLMKNNKIIYSKQHGNFLCGMFFTCTTFVSSIQCLGSFTFEYGLSQDLYVLGFVHACTYPGAICLNHSMATVLFPIFFLYAFDLHCKDCRITRQHVLRRYCHSSSCPMSVSHMFVRLHLSEAQHTIDFATSCARYLFEERPKTKTDNGS